MSAQAIKELREKTGAGFLECKKALDESGGDLDKAVEHLRKLGLKAASNKATRIAADGIVAVQISSDGKCGVLVEVNSETDFVAKNDDFKKFAADLASLISKNPPADLNALLASKLGGQTVTEFQNALIAKIGEKISVRRFAVLEASAGEKIGSYIHLGNKIGVLALVKGEGEGSVLKDVAMHVAASHPLYLTKSEIPSSVLAKEKEIFMEQLKSSGKPAAILEKIVEGKLAKFAS
ncbi:MAG: translation elongation factor Ts, partial [Deltaproteobacteria bacterium]|nr:translation elongation factor Ts [Deltaproteobacteria bacterium]